MASKEKDTKSTSETAPSSPPVEETIKDKAQPLTAEEKERLTTAPAATTSPDPGARTMGTVPENSAENLRMTGKVEQTLAAVTERQAGLPPDQKMDDAGAEELRVAVEKQAALDELANLDNTIKLAAKDDPRDSKNRVPRDQPLPDALIDGISGANLRAVALDRGYDLGPASDATSVRQAFRDAQKADKTLKQSTKKSDDEE